jgi:chemotaxis protein MotB
VAFKRTLAILVIPCGVDPAQARSARVQRGSLGTDREGRAIDRRIRIVILPKLDRFFGMIEDGLEQAQQMGNR